MKLTKTHLIQLIKEELVNTIGGVDKKSESYIQGLKDGKKGTVRQYPEGNNTEYDKGYHNGEFDGTDDEEEI